MPESALDTQTAGAESKDPVIAGLGKTTKMKMMSFDGNGGLVDEDNNAVVDKAAEGKADDVNAGKDGLDGKEAKPQFTDEQLKEYFKAQGIDYEGVDKLKEKLTPNKSTELTDEQKVEINKAKEKRVMDLFLSKGGTVEQYVALKGLSEANLADLSLAELKEDLKKKKFTEEEADEIIKARYFQTDDEEIEQYEDETKKDFEKRKKQVFAEQLTNRSTHTKAKAAEVLADLYGAIEFEDTQKKNEQTLSANIDEQFKNLSRKDTYEIGEINGKAITPIESEVPETELEAIREMLRTPAKRKQFLNNQDGSLNISKVADILAENAKLKAAIKVSYHEGSSRNNAHWEKTFGAKSGYELGVGGSNQKPIGQKGQPASFGKTQKVQPQRQ